MGIVNLESQHNEVLQKLYKKYEFLENESDEKKAFFSWDGPNDVETYERAPLKVLFLVKEARDQWSAGKGQVPGNKYSRNLLRWHRLIQSILVDGKIIPFIEDDQLPPNCDELCLVEVKKLDEGNGVSAMRTINLYAKEDKELLREQIDLLSPDIVFCCYTHDAYDYIYEVDFDPCIEIVRIKNCPVWNLSNRMVIHFFHPSTWPAFRDEITETDRDRFNLLTELLINELVQSFAKSILGNK